MPALVYLKPWISGRSLAVKALLFFLLLMGFMQFGLYGLVQSYVLGYLGAQPEDISFSVQASYAAIIASLPIQSRLLRYFELKRHLLAMLTASIIISIAFRHIDDIYVFILIRLLAGFAICGIVLCSLTLVLSRLTPAETVTGFTVFYGTLLGSGVLSGTLVYQVTDNTDWAQVYLYLILAQAVAIIAVVLALRSKTGQRPYPLYQIDWMSFMLALILYLALAFTFIYGPRYYWTADPRIRISIFIALCSLAVLVYRQGVLKRPYLHPDIFRHKPFILGMLLLAVYYGVKDSINLVYAYTQIVLKWNTYQLVLLSACNVAGLVICMIVSARMLQSKKFPVPLFFLGGFALLLVYHLWMYQIFSTDLSFSDLAGPVVLQGAASGFLFVPIIVFAMATLPPQAGFTGVTLGAFTRFFATINGTAGFYTLQLHYNQQYKESFLRHTSLLDAPFTQRLQQYATVFRTGGYTPEQSNALATALVNRDLTVQSQLLTNMTVFKVMSVVILVVLVVIAGVMVVGRMKRKRMV